MNTKVNAFAVSGTVGFVAAKFVFGRSTKTALIVGATLGAIAVAITCINLPQPTNPI